MTEFQSTATGYRIMWVMVMFDIPVDTKARRKKAAAFRNGLLDLGFTMSQFSIYAKFCGNRDVADRLLKQVGRIVPGIGTVSAICFTDRQYENMKIWHTGAPETKSRKREQLQLF